MRSFWLKGAAAVLALWLLPLQGLALETQNLFADVQGLFSRHMNEWMTTAMEQNIRDLDIALTSDKTQLCAGETARMQVEIVNPRMHPCTVTYQFTLSEEACFAVSGAPMEETLFLPAARLTETGEIIPGSVRRTYGVTMQPTAQDGEGWMRVTAAASMQEGSRWYQSAQNLTLCAPQVSAVLRATHTTPAPQEMFFYELVLTNSGSAAAENAVQLTLPTGVSYAPGEENKASADEAQEMTTLRAQGNTIFATVQVPAAKYDAQGALLEASQTILRVPVTVDAQVLDDVPKAQRVLSCGAQVDGQKLQEERITVCGPIIDCTLTPTMRDMEMGETMYYTCRVENSGYAPADVRVTVQMPQGMEFTRFSTRGQGNKIAGDTLSWRVHLEKPLRNIAGEPEPTHAVITYQVRASALDEGVKALIIPATAAYQIGESGKPLLTKTALTTVHRPTVCGLSAEEWLVVCGVGGLLALAGGLLVFFIRRDAHKGD